MTSFARRVSADHASVSTLRRDASDWLRAVLGPDSGTTLEDLAVVLTELAANVVDHTDSSLVDVDVRVDGEFVTVQVTNTGPVTVVPPTGEWGHVSDGDRGRGLRLVAALSDEILVVGDEHRTTITCRRRLT